MKWRGTNFTFGMVIHPNNRIGSAVIRTWSRGCRVFCRPDCILLTQHFLPKKGSRWLFLKNGSQIRILRPRIDLFHDSWRMSISSKNLRPKVERASTRPVTCLQNTRSDTWPSSWVGQSYSFMVDYIPMEIQGYSPSGFWNAEGGWFLPNHTPPIPTAYGVDVYRWRVKQR